MVEEAQNRSKIFHKSQMTRKEKIVRDGEIREDNLDTTVHVIVLDGDAIRILAPVPGQSSLVTWIGRVWPR